MFMRKGGTSHTSFHLRRESRESVEVIIDKNFSNAVEKHWEIVDRVLLVIFYGKPIINIIQGYAPKADSSEEEVEEYYNHLGSAKKQCKKSKLVIMGDFSTEVGNQSKDHVLGGCGLLKCDDTGDRLVGWAKSH